MANFTFLLLQRLLSDAVSDLTTGIWSHVRLKRSKVDNEKDCRFLWCRNGRLRRALWAGGAKLSTSTVLECLPLTHTHAHTHPRIPTSLIDSSLCSHLCAANTVINTLPLSPATRHLKPKEDKMESKGFKHTQKILSFLAVVVLWISSGEHDSRFQESSLRQCQIADAAIKGR
ncbi:hypothetical protein J6590_006309 [Homalodisca vitripennis]|nr:hypothetical protein J6590_006309 [Homalodisca vitripennis]